MSRLFSSFVFFLFTAIQISFGQLNVNFTTATPNPGETIEINVSVSNFVNIELFQFGIGWDSTVASFVSVTNITTDLVDFDEGNIGTPENAALIDDGEIALSWSETNTNPVSIADGTVLFTIVLDVVGEACDETTFMVTPPPVGGNIEVYINNLSENIGATSSGGLVSIPGQDCEGGGMDGVGLIGSMEMGETGTQVCVEVSTENFSNIASLQTGIVWDESIIDYVSVQEAALTGISLNENEVDNGELKLLWLIEIGDDPVTVADGTVLFEVCFDLIGTEGQMSDISFVDLQDFDIEFADGDGISLDYFVENGKINISEGDIVETCDTGVGLIGDSLNAFGLTSVCVPVTSKDFINIASVQTGIVWNENVIDYTGINEGAMTSISVNDNEAANGELKLLWLIGITEDPVTVDDGTVLFELCFDIVGSVNESSSVSFVDLPDFNIEIANGDGISVEYCTITGFVDLTEDDGGGGESCDVGVGLIADSLSTNGATNICIPVTAKDFINIASVQTGITWDETVLEFTAVNDGAMTGVTMNAANADMGELKLLWIIDIGDDPVTVDDGTVLFEICFEVLGAEGSSSSVSFVDLPDFDIEIANGDGVAEEYCTITGYVEVTEDDGGGGEGCDVGVGLIGDSLSTEGLTSICVPVTSKDFINIASVQTGITWDETILEFTAVNDGAMTGVTMNAANADMGELKLLWIIDIGDDPVTVDDGTVLFEICFEVLGAEGSSSSISFVDLPDFDIEIANGDGVAEEYCTITGYVEVTEDDGGGGEGCDVGVGLIGDSLSTEGLTSICVPVTSKDFINIASVQTGITWDETVLEFTAVNDGAMTGVTVNAANADMGELKLLWIIDIGDDPVTVDDGTVLFEICFDVLGAEGSSSSISFVDLPDFDIEIANGDGVAEEYCTITGYVEVTEDDGGGGEGCDVGVGLIGDSLSTEGLTSICVPVTSKDFINIASVQTGITWDETVLEFTAVNDGAMTGVTVNAANADMGELKLLWIIDIGDDPVTVDDGTVLFEICFDVLGAEGSSSSISFVDLPDFEIEIANGDGVAEEYCTITGFVDVTEGVITETCDVGVGLIGDSLSTEGLTSICVPVTAKDFINIASVQTGITWDETVLELTALNDGAMTGVTVNAANADMGELKLLWIIDIGDDPVTVDDGTVLFEICFDVLGAEGSSSSVSFVDLPDFEIEIANGDGVAEEYCTITGFVDVTEGVITETCDVGVGLIGDSLSTEGLTSICVPVTAKDFINIASVQTGIIWDETVLELTALNDGAMTGVTVNAANADMGELKLLWIIDIGEDPVTVDDGTVLFEICFDVLGAEGSSSSVSFVDLPDFEIEIANGDGVAEEYCTITGFVDVTEGVITETCDVGVGLIGDSLSTEGLTSICVPVTAKDFINIASVQTGIIWDETVLELTALNDGAMTGVTVNAANADMGELKLLWIIDIGEDPVTVDDGTVLFEICFDVLGAEGSSSSVSFVDLPDFEIEIANGDGVAEEYCTITGFVDVTEGVITETCDVGVGLIGDSLSTEGLTSICVPVTAKDFINIASVQTGITWDETVLELTALNDGAMTGVTVNAANADMGELKLLWIIDIGEDPVTVDDGTVLFEICFDVLGAEGSSSSVSFVDLPDFDIEIANGDGVAEEYCTITGFVDVTEGVITETCDVGVGLIGDSLSTNGATDICVPVTAKDFINIASVQTGITWDETVLELTALNDGAMTGVTVNAANADMGELKLLWIIDIGDDPVTVDDGTVLFEICFEVLGDLGSSSSVSFTDLPDFEIEIANGDGVAEEYCTITGFVQVTEGTVEDCETGVGLIGDTLTIDPAETPNFCMPITTENFENIASIQTGIQWDPSVLSFTGVNEVSITGASLNTANSANGDIRYLWIIDIGDDPVTLEDESVLFEICFDAVGADGSMSDVDFVDLDNFEVEVANGEGMAEPVCIVPGKVTIEEVIIISDFSLITEDVSAEQGSEVCLDVDVTGFVNLQSTQFTMMWDETVLSYNRVEMLNPDICDLTQNNFFQPMDTEDKLRVSWSCANGSIGSTVADSSLFFKVCFDVIGECNPPSSTTVEFVDDPPILIEVTNVNNDEIDPVLLVQGSVTVIECEAPFMCMLNSVDHVDCTGDASGGIFVDFSGAVGNVTCTWTGPGGPYSDCDLQGIVAGTYMLTSEDEDGRTCMLEVEVTEPDEALSLEGQTTDAVCGEGGSVDVTVAGGTGDRTFNWNPDQGNVEDLSNVGPGEYCLTVTDVNNCTIDMCFTVEDSAPALNITSATTTNISCNSMGSIDISVEGGCTPISYDWSFNGSPISTDQDVSDLKEGGSYTVVISDNSDPIQEITMNYVLTSSVTELMVTGESSDLSCFGEMDGSIDISVEGGCPAYTFIWDNGESTEDISGLSTGMYCVSVNDQFCPEDDPIVMCFEVEEPEPVMIDLVGIQHVTNLQGNNGVIDIEPQGGVGDFTFNWSPNGSNTEDQINMPPGEYCVTVTDGSGCSAEACYTITWAAVFLDNCTILPSDCMGECTGSVDCDIVGGCSDVEIRVNGVLANSFPLTELCAGSYEIVISDECGNTDMETFIIEDPGDMDIDTVRVVCTSMDENTGLIEISILGGSPPYDITWGGAASCDGSTLCDELGVGFYTVVVEDSNGCQAILQNIEITECPAPPDDCFDGRPIITPNGDGFNDQFLITCADGNSGADLQVYDRWGRLVYEQSNYDSTWEGTHSNGTMLDDGGYMWVLQISLPNGDTILRNGTLTILRNNF